ncbi:MAG: chemotaxis protein [Ruminococcus sp.]|jgi:two-component system chemotaxis response regulator CheV|nr:chemotaxis protein [Ruminococcus sp.]
METNILLESGTNELELLVFEVGDSLFGINIAKVVEIMIDSEVTPVPNAAPEVEGVFIPRDKLISVIDLHKVINATKKPEKNMFVICEFNKLTVAFRVGNVEGIQRISWSDISDPPAMGSSGTEAGISTGVVKIDGKIIIIMDFEKIVSKLNLTSGFDDSGIDSLTLMSDRVGNKRLVVADDSAFLNEMVVKSLSKVGFKNIVSFSNGLDAWEYVSSFKNVEGEITDHIACVISDIEMPKMDGHALTKRIKDDRTLKKIPVLLFSSLINEQMIQKCVAVGADGQFSKPQIKDLIELSIRLIAAE